MRPKSCLRVVFDELNSVAVHLERLGLRIGIVLAQRGMALGAQHSGCVNKGGGSNRRRVFADLCQILSPVCVSNATTVATVGSAASAPGNGGAA